MKWEDKTLTMLAAVALNPLAHKPAAKGEGYLQLKSWHGEKGTGGHEAVPKVRGWSAL